MNKFINKLVKAFLQLYYKSKLLYQNSGENVIFVDSIFIKKQQNFPDDLIDEETGNS